MKLIELTKVKGRFPSIREGIDASGKVIEASRKVMEALGKFRL